MESISELLGIIAYTHWETQVGPLHVARIDATNKCGGPSDCWRAVAKELEKHMSSKRAARNPMMQSWPRDR